MTCDQPSSPAAAWAAAAVSVPLLLAEAGRSADSGKRVPPDWLARISPVTNFAGRPN